MEEITPLFKETITIEFYIDDNKKIHVIYNTREMSISKFWKEGQDASKICKHIVNEFKIQFPEKYKSAGLGSKDWREIFLKIINNHLSVLDNVLDVFIRRSGEVVFKLEQ